GVTNSQIQPATADARPDMLRRAEAPPLARLETALTTLRTEAQLPPPASRLALLRALQACLDPQTLYPLDAPAHGWLQQLRDRLDLDTVAAAHPDKDNTTGLSELDRLCQTKGLVLQDLAQGEEVIGKILLTTYHSSKGREFDTVILPGLQNGIIPRSVPERGTWRAPNAREREEQRRTFYVALTRAERTLHLIYGPGYHTKNGYWRPDGPSDFLTEMDSRLPPAD
ncbi:3'-5' exonuclease, partial [Streptomyces sp. NPDC127084]|uniref:3'-5' exonuclease n=1 Tax=Streptomyces sp. NPDC127084 TaxID=3347133 RepID=UPI0036549E6C